MKLAIITSHLAHYRRHLYKLLDETAGTEVTHFSGGPNKKGIQPLNSNEVQNIQPVRNIKFLRLHWQQGVVHMAMRDVHDAYIFTGDVKYISTWVASSILRLKKKQVYFWTIGWHRPETGIRNFLRLTFYKLADKLLLYGDQEKYLAISQGYPAEKIAVIYNSVSAIDDIDVEEIASAKDGNCVGAIARLNPVKNFNLLIEAVAILKNEGEDIQIVLGGDGPERQPLEEKAQQLGVKCNFLGPVHDDSEIKEFYKRVSVTVMPSVAGLTTIQSLSHGVPVITDNNELTQAPEASAIIPGVTGARYEAGSAQALANQIRTWLNLVESAPHSIARQCEGEVRSRWSPAVQAERMLDAIEAPNLP